MKARDTRRYIVKLKAEIERQSALLQEATKQAEHWEVKWHEQRAEIERLSAERDQWNADARRLSGGLMAIRGAAETVPASVLRGIAYDIALNCIEPDVAEYQIERRAALEPKPLIDALSAALADQNVKMGLLRAENERLRADNESLRRALDVVPGKPTEKDIEWASAALELKL